MPNVELGAKAFEPCIVELLAIVHDYSLRYPKATYDVYSNEVCTLRFGDAC